MQDPNVILVISSIKDSDTWIAVAVEIGKGVNWDSCRIDCRVTGTFLAASDYAEHLPEKAKSINEVIQFTIPGLGICTFLDTTKARTRNRKVNINTNSSMHTFTFYKNEQSFIEKYGIHLL